MKTLQLIPTLTLLILFTSCEDLKLDKPKADFSTEINGLEVSFTSKATGEIEAHTWEFGDNEVSQKENPTHTYDQAGNYEVRLTVTNAAGDGIREKSISVQ